MELNLSLLRSETVVVHGLWSQQSIVFVNDRKSEFRYEFSSMRRIFHPDVLRKRRSRTCPPLWMGVRRQKQSSRSRCARILSPLQSVTRPAST